MVTIPNRLRIIARLEDGQFTRSIDRLENRIDRLQRAAGRIRLPSGGAALRGVGGVAGVVGAGAGLGAGLVIAEQIFERLFELFENTDLLETFTATLTRLLRVAAPLAGSIIDVITPVLEALIPAIEPLVELIGANLLIAVTLLTPAVRVLATGIEQVTTFIRNTIFELVQFVIEQLNRLPFVDIALDVDRMTGSLERASAAIRQAEQTAREREGSAPTSRLPDIRDRVGSPETIGPNPYTPITNDITIVIDGRDVARQVASNTRRDNLRKGRDE